MVAPVGNQQRQSGGEPVEHQRAVPRSDLEAGRPTEGEHTIGDLVRPALRRGIDAPILRAALCNLQIHEARRGALA